MSILRYTDYKDTRLTIMRISSKVLFSLVMVCTPIEAGHTDVVASVAIMIIPGTVAQTQSRVSFEVSVIDLTQLGGHWKISACDDIGFKIAVLLYAR